MHEYEQGDAKRQERIDEGRGTGTGADYLSWIAFRDFRSKGDESRKSEGRHGREILTLSQIEARTFFMLDVNPDVIEIYDQYPLDREETRSIARDLGIEHPKCPRSGADLDMTSDFLAEVRTDTGIVQFPFQCKSSTDVSNFRIAEKMEIERRYWQAHDKKLRVVTESPACIPDAFFKNARRLQQHRFLHKAVVNDVTLTYEHRKALILVAVRAATASETLNELAGRLAQQTSHSIDQFTQVISNLIYRGDLVCNMHAVDLLSQNVLAVSQATQARVDRLARRAS